MHLRTEIGDGNLGVVGGGVSPVGPLTFHVTLRIDTPAALPAPLGLSEEFTLSLGLSQLSVDALAEVLILEEAAMQLGVGQLTKVACLLAVLDGLNIVPQITLGGSQLSLTRARDSSAQIPRRKLDIALETLDTEIGSGATSGQLAHMVNYVIKSVILEATAHINGYDYTEDRDAITTCAEPGASPLEGSWLLFALGNVGNITASLKGGFGPQPAPETPAEAETRVVLRNARGSSAPEYFSWQDSLLGAVVPTFVHQLNRVKLDALFGDWVDDTSGGLASRLFSRETDGRVTVTLPLYELFALSFGLDGLVNNGELRVNSFALRGLNNLDLSKLMLIEPQSDFVLGTRIVIPGATEIAFNVTLVVPEEMLTGVPSDVLVEDTITVSMGVVDLDIDVEMLLAMDLDLVADWRLGHFLAVDADQDFGLAEHAASCLFASFFEGGLYLPRFIIDVSDVLSPAISTSNVMLSEGMQLLIEAAIEVGVEVLKDNLADATQGALRTLLNEWVLERAIAGEENCPADVPPAPLAAGDEILDWQRSNAGAAMRWLDAQLAGEDGSYAGLNGALGGLFADRRLLAESPLSFGLNLGYYGVSYGNVSLAISDISLEGLDTMTGISPLLPQSAHELMLNASLDGPLVIGVTVTFEFENAFGGYDGDEDATSSVDTVRFTVSIADFAFALGLDVEVNVPRALQTVNVGALFNTTEVSCALQGLDALRVYYADLALNAFGLTAECVGVCTSPLAEPLLKGPVVMLSADGETVENIASLVATGIQLGKDYVMSEDFNNVLEVAVGNASQNCLDVRGFGSAALDNFKKQDTTVPDIMGSLMLIFAVFMGLVFLYVVSRVPLHFSRRAKMLADAQATYGDTEARDRVNLATMSFHAHPAVPRGLKVCLPTVFALTSGLLVASLSMVAFTLDVQVVIAGNRTPRIPLVAFSINRFISDFWFTEGYAMAIILFVGAVSYPILKNVLLLYCWFAPATVLSRSKRDTVIDVLDTLGRWSFADVFVIGIIAALLHFAVDVNMAGFLAFVPSELAFLETHISPREGIIILSLAAAVALGSTHFMQYYLRVMKEYEHDKRLEWAGAMRDPLLEKLKNQKLRMYEYQFQASPPGIVPGQRYQVLMRVLVGAGLLFTMGLLAMAMALPIARFEYDGLLGMLLEVIDSDKFAQREHSYATFALSFRDSRSTPRQAVEYSLAILFYEVLFWVCIIIFPFAQVFFLGVLWYAPLTYREARMVKFVSGICSSWAALEVLLVAVFLTIQQAPAITRHVTGTITDGRCQSAAPLLSSFLGEQNGQCLNLAADWTPFLPLVIVGVAGQLLCSFIMVRVVNVSLNDRERALTTPIPSAKPDDAAPESAPRLGRAHRDPLHPRRCQQRPPQAHADLDAVQQRRVHVRAAVLCARHCQPGSGAGTRAAVPRRI